MTMRSAVPDWLTPVGWIYIAISMLSAVLIAADIYLNRRRLDGTAIELVWLTSALYLGPFALALYLTKGRTSPNASGREGPTDSAGVVVLPGGSASAVAHLIGVPLVAFAGWTIAGMAMWPMIIVIAVLAIVMLAVYEWVPRRSGAARPPRRLSIGAAVVTAVVTVAAFDVGMVGWMVLLHLNDLMPPVTEGAFWFLMQVGILVGLVTGYPAVRWLVQRNRAVVPA